MESQQQDKDENLFTRDADNDFSSGPLVDAADEDEDDENEAAADDELDEEL